MLFLFTLQAARRQSYGGLAPPKPCYSKFPIYKKIE